MTTATVEGVDELVMKLNKMAAKADGPQIAAALRAGALLIENKARELAPVDTGTLRRSIHTQVEQVRDGAVARIGVPALSDQGDDLGYSIYQELGTSRMRAHPYLRPAFNSERNAALAEIKRALQQMVKP